MKKLKIIIEFTLKGDMDDQDTLKEDLYQRLQSDMEEDDLQYEVVDPEEDEEDEYEIN